MSDGLIVQLRDWAKEWEGGTDAALCEEAANRIEAAEARVAELEEVLRVLCNRIQEEANSIRPPNRHTPVFFQYVTAARQALSGSSNEASAKSGQPSAVREAERAVVEAAMRFHREGDGVNTSTLYEMFLQACDCLAKAREQEDG